MSTPPPNGQQFPPNNQRPQNGQPYGEQYTQPYPPVPPGGRQYPPTPPPRRMSRGARIALAIGIPVLALLLLLGLAIAIVGATRTGPISESIDAAAGSSVVLDVPNAVIALSPSDDDDVHVTLSGEYAGATPTLEVTDVDGETVITGGCPRGWFVFNRCSVRIEVTLPADLDVTSDGQNGSVTASSLDGDLDLSTTNGSILVNKASGVLDLGTTNGRIELTDSRSREVEAETTNGAVRLEFAEAPEQVSAESTNGEILVRVPDDNQSSRVEADTTNGSVETADILTDPDSDRSISANTTNGRVTIEQAG